MSLPWSSVLRISDVADSSTTATAVRAIGYLALAGALVWLHLSMREFATDDAYIHLRIARNWLEHGAPYYNPGHAVLATSSPAWTVLLTGIFTVTGVQIAAVSALNAILLTASVATTSGALREVSGHDPWLCDLAALLLVLPLVLEASLLHMEVPLAVLAVTWGTWLHLRDSRGGLAVFAFGVFVRPELAVVFVIALVDVARRTTTEETARRLGAGLLAVSPILLFLLVYFDTPVPQPVQAKRIVYELSRSQAFERIVGDLPRPPGWATGVGPVLWCLAPVALLARAARARTLSGKTIRVSAGLVVAGSAIVAAYVLTGVMTFPWYPPLYLVPVGLSLGLCLISVPKRWTAAVLGLLTLYPALGAARTTVGAALDESRRLRHAPYREAARTRQYLAVGRQLYRKYPDASLLASEIGGLGFTFRGPIHDAVGLVSPGALKYHPLDVPTERSSGFLGAIPVDYVRQIDPDLVVSLSTFVEDFRRSELRSRYRLTRRPVIPSQMTGGMDWTVWGSRYLLIFQKRTLPPLR